MAAITRQLDELKARAILEPTSENIVNYIRFQREQLDRASTFADVWSRAIWQNPELDYTLERPVSTLAKQTWLTDRRQQREGSMAALTERYGRLLYIPDAAHEMKGVKLCGLRFLYKKNDI